MIRAYAKSANANDSEIVSTEIVISGNGNSSEDNTGGSTGGNNSGNNNGNTNGGNSNNTNTNGGNANTNNNNNNTNTTNTTNTNTNVTVPKTSKLSIKTLKNVKGKKVKLTWKAPAKLYGDNFYVEKYTIMYTTDKKFKKNKKTVNIKATTTARTIKRLKKGKTYYFKIQYTVKYKAE